MADGRLANFRFIGRDKLNFELDPRCIASPLHTLIAIRLFLEDTLQHELASDFANKLEAFWQNG